MPKHKNSKKRSLKIDNLKLTKQNRSNVQPLGNKGLYIRGDDLKALIEKLHNYDEQIS